MISPESPSAEEYIVDFTKYARPNEHFPLAYWCGVASKAREMMEKSNAPGVVVTRGGTGFPPTGYDISRVYGGESPASPHDSDDDRLFPPSHLFDENGYYQQHIPPAQTGGDNVALESVYNAQKQE